MLLGCSVLNLFDNELIIPVEFTTPQEIYIRHVDKDGNLLNISNDSEIKISSDNTKSVINNSGEKTIKRSDKTEVKYQEYYKIYLGEKLQVSRSLTMASNGKMYKYKNAIVSSAKTATDAANNDDINKNSNKKQILLLKLVEILMIKRLQLLHLFMMKLMYLDILQLMIIMIHLQEIFILNFLQTIIVVNVFKNIHLQTKI